MLLGLCNRGMMCLWKQDSSSIFYVNVFIQKKLAESNLLEGIQEFNQKSDTEKDMFINLETLKHCQPFTTFSYHVLFQFHWKHVKTFQVLNLFGNYTFPSFHLRKMFSVLWKEIDIVKTFLGFTYIHDRYVFSLDMFWHNDYLIPYWKERSSSILNTFLERVRKSILI